MAGVVCRCRRLYHSHTNCLFAYLHLPLLPPLRSFPALVGRLQGGVPRWLGPPDLSLLTAVPQVGAWRVAVWGVACVFVHGLMCFV